MSTTILNIETATDVCSICISREETILAKVATEEPFQHAKRITLLIEQCLQESGLALKEIDALAVSKGPGSYTALRIGISTAKGIAYALDKPVVAVDTLRSLARASARQFERAALYQPMIDARRMEVYTAPFDQKGEPLGLAEAQVIDENSFQEALIAGKTIVLSGNGAAKCKAVLPSERVVCLDIVCDSAHLVPLAHRAFQAKDFVDIAYFAPFYLKPPNITKAKSRL